LIDDDQSCNFILREFILLENEEVDTVECYSVDSALEFLTNTNDFPDAIFLDLNMPVKSGFEFLEVYSKIFFQNHQSTKVIVLTSSLRPSDKTQTTAYECVSSFRSKSEINEFIGEIINH
jgi:CheY-like chemotaxis protein